NHARGTAFGKQLAEITLNESGAPALYEFEQLRCLAAYIAEKRRLNFSGLPLQASQQLLQCSWKIGRTIRCDPLELGFHVTHRLEQDGLYKRCLARKMCVQRLFAHTQLFCQVIHGHGAEAVSEKMAAGRSDNSLQGSIFRRKVCYPCFGLIHGWCSGNTQE